jgi:hypothetical protein
MSTESLRARTSTESKSDRTITGPIIPVPTDQQCAGLRGSGINCDVSVPCVLPFQAVVPVDPAQRLIRIPRASRSSSRRFELV